jgi:MoxR-like ATPase
MQYNIPILLEEPTGRSKTRIAELICTLLRTEPIRLIYSVETAAENTIGGLTNDTGTDAGRDLPF